MEFQQKILYFSSNSEKNKGLTKSGLYILSSLFALVLVLANLLSKSLNMALFPYVFALDNSKINNK